MKQTTSYNGRGDAFEGDRTIWLRNLPAGASVKSAILTLAPATINSEHPFEETFVFAPSPDGPNELRAADWGVSKNSIKDGLFVEVYFHTRRTVTAVLGTQEDNIGVVPGTEIHGVTLQADMGGAYIGIANDGTFMAPGKVPLALQLHLVPANNSQPDVHLEPWLWCVVETENGEDNSQSDAHLEPVRFPSVVASKFSLSATPARSGDLTGRTIDVSKVIVRSLPSNLTVRFGKSPPFWSRVGELAASDSSPDFSGELSSFLASSQPQDGFYAIPFTIHSDTLCRLNATIVIDYTIEQTLLPAHLPDITLAYGFSRFPNVVETLEGVLNVTLPRRAIPTQGQTIAQIRGEFQPTRIALDHGAEGSEECLGNPSTDSKKVRPDAPQEFFEVIVSPDHTLAQAVVSKQEIALTGIDLALESKDTALTGLNVAIRSDEDGKPSDEVLIKADVRIEKPLPGHSVWGSALLPRPFRVLPCERYWLILQSLNGEFVWTAIDLRAESQGPIQCIDAERKSQSKAVVPLQFSRDGGLSWRAATGIKKAEPSESAPPNRQAQTSASLAATSSPLSSQTAQQAQALSTLFRFRDTPERFSVPLLFQVGKGEVKNRCLNEFSALGRVEFSFDFAGTLKDYLETAQTISPCGSGNLITNGDFSMPPSDDATRKVFGSDSITVRSEAQAERAIFTGSVRLSQGVNLSVEQFITLSGSGFNPVRVKIAGRTSSRTLPAEIVEAINSAIKAKVNSTSESARRLSNTAILFAYELSNDKSGKLMLSFPGSDDILRALSETELPPRFKFHRWIQTQDPANWQGTPGKIHRLRIPDQTGRVVVVLAEPSFLQDLMDEPRVVGEGLVLPSSLSEGASHKERRPCEGSLITLSQTVEVSAGCAYLFQFSYQITSPEFNETDPSITPRWEVEWQGSHEINNEAELLPSDSDTLELPEPNDQLAQSGGAFSSTVETRLVAPVGAIKAVLRFVNPLSQCALILKAVSFAPTLETLTNPRFAQWQHMPGDTSPAGWTRIGGIVDRAVVKETGQPPVNLQGDGPEDSIISQIVEVRAGASYELKVKARPELPRAGDQQNLPVQQRARIELQWQASALVDRARSSGEPLGQLIQIPLDGHDFEDHRWVGIAPEKASQVLIRIIQPQNQGEGNLLIYEVSLSDLDLISVPLTFLAEAPGSLTILNLRVAYELPDLPARPEPFLQPALITITPTSINSQSQDMAGSTGDASRDDSSGAEKPEMTTAIVRAPENEAPQLPPAGELAGGETQPATAPVIIEDAFPGAALMVLKGIKQKRAKLLGENGIDTLEKLANETKEHIAELLQGVSQDLADKFINQAKDKTNEGSS